MPINNLMFRLSKAIIANLNSTVFEKLPFPPSWRYTILDGQEVVAVSLSEDIIRQASEIGERIHTVARVKGLIEWMASNSAWRSAGFRGQLAAALFFCGDFQEAFKFITVGESDQGDLLLGDTLVNVCTRAIPYGGNSETPVDNVILIDTRRFRVKPYPIYVGCQCFGDDRVIIWGYATKEQVGSLPTDTFRTKCYYKLLSELEPIRTLKEIFTTGGLSHD